MPKSRVYRIVRKGEVRVNKGRVKPEYKLAVGDVVRVPPVRVAERGAEATVSAGLDAHLQAAILFEDERLIIVNKPSGLAFVSVWSQEPITALISDSSLSL